MKELQQAIENIHAYVNNAILNKEFDVLKRGEHVTTIKCGEYTCDVWMANTPIDTGVYRIYTSICTLDFCGVGLALNSPSTCRKIINTPTSEEERKALAERKKKLESELAKLNEIGD